MWKKRVRNDGNHLAGVSSQPLRYALEKRRESEAAPEPQASTESAPMGS